MSHVPFILNIHLVLGTNLQIHLKIYDQRVNEFIPSNELCSNFSFCLLVVVATDPSYINY